MNEIDLSVIIPCYRDAGHLRANVGTVVRCLQDLRLSWEILLVNDASPERDGAAALEVLSDWPNHDIRVITHERNTGRGKTVADGLAEARGRYAGFLDIDLEVGAHYIAPIFRMLAEGADVVCAHRVYKTSISLLHRAVLSHGYVMMVRYLLGVDLPDTEAGYKFFKLDTARPVINACADPGWFWDTEVMVRSRLAGLDIRFQPVLFLRNREKASTVRLFADSAKHIMRLWKFRREIKNRP